MVAGMKANRQEFLNSKDRKYNDDKNKDFNDMDRIALKPCHHVRTLPEAITSRWGPTPYQGNAG